MNGDPSVGTRQASVNHVKRKEARGQGRGAPQLPLITSVGGWRGYMVSHELGSVRVCILCQGQEEDLIGPHPCPLPLLWPSMDPILPLSGLVVIPLNLPLYSRATD